MPEDPIKLFATRAERYPEPTDSDVAHGAARAVIAQLPLGGAINEVLSLVISPSLGRRRDEWLRDLADVVDRTEAQCENFQPENLVQNEAFISAAVQASRIAIGTHKKENGYCCAMCC